MNIANIDQQRFCVFRSGSNWFGLPALCLSQVAARPALTPIPGSDRILCGLAHVRNEFLPVFSLSAITELEERDHLLEDRLLVVESVQGSWGLLIDQTIAVAELETSFSSMNAADDLWSTVTAGSASYRDQVLQILDPTALLKFVVFKLNAYWDSPGSTDLFTPGNSKQLSGELV